MMKCHKIIGVNLSHLASMMMDLMKKRKIRRNKIKEVE
jgi:hypothetical protein